MERITKKIDYEFAKGYIGQRGDALNKLGRLEDLEEQIGCPLEVLYKAFELFVNWAEECDFGYDNIPDEYEKYKDDIEDMDYIKGLMYIAIQEAKADRSE